VVGGGEEGVGEGWGGADVACVGGAACSWWACGVFRACLRLLKVVSVGCVDTVI